jgi:N-dimethylarginine dimethylaminohydrolase
MKKTAHWLMCQPLYFGVSYEINPWMRGNIGEVNHARAMVQWQRLYDILSTHATVHLLPPVPHLPDLCFTANAGLVWNKTCMLSHFKCAERQGEEPHFLDWFHKNGYTLHRMPDAIAFEGEGDALFELHPGAESLTSKPIAWIGHGMRTDLASHRLVSDLLHIDIQSLHLVNPHFYHLDTCFALLPEGRLIYYPDAFDAPSLEKIQQHFPAEKRYAVEETDALHFACNAIICGDVFICNQASPHMQAQLQTWGFTVITTPLSEFMLAGGAAKCLALGLYGRESNEVS